MYGFIGAGNIGSAIINGMLSNHISKSLIYVNANTQDTREKLIEMGLNVCSCNQEVADNCKYVFLAIKPNEYDSVLYDIKESLRDDTIIIIMAVGYNISKAKEIIGNKKVVRIMPNTPVLVDAGYTVFSFDALISNDEKKEVIALLKTFSEIKEIKESLMNAYSAVTASSPAFISVMIEAMSDAAVLMGIPRKDAYKAIEYTLLGSAKLAIESSKHPAELKDMVCSPGGTTIEGIRTLEQTGFRSNLIEALLNTYKKTFDLSKIR